MNAQSKMPFTTFMMDLMTLLKSEKGLEDSTIKSYLSTLFALNESKPFKNLMWLKQYENVEKILEGYADTTKESKMGIILSVLDLFKGKPNYNTIYKFWLSKQKGFRTTILDDKPSHAMSDKQKENWVSWEEVQVQKKLLNDAVKDLAGKKTLTEKEYDTLLSNVVLSLYTEIAPRRNQDYSDMYVVKNFLDDATKNYLSLDEKKFQFNKYKTSKTHGSMTVDIPESLMNAITAFLKHHPLNKGRLSKKTCFQLLVKQDGTPINAVNGITRILNKIFGKNIGSSMLRHIFLSSVYGDKVKELEGVAKGMGHSSTTQAGYVLDEQIDE